MAQSPRLRVGLARGRRLTARGFAHAAVGAALAILVPAHATAGQRASPANPVLQVGAVTFEPVRQGRNVLRVAVRNTGDRSEIFAIGIQARSPDYGTGIGWGTQFTASIAASQTKDLRFVYRVYGPITDKTLLSLSFYNPPSADEIEAAFLLERRQYSGTELPRARGGNDEPARRPDAGQRAVVAAVLRQTQLDLRSKRYGEAWRAFSSDLCAVDFCRTESDFRENIASETSRMKPFLWPMDRFLAFEPAEARLGDDGRIVLLGGSGDPGMRVYFVREEGSWKVDDIGGYVPKVVLWRTWEQRLLPKMETRRTKHFDLFYEKGSPAASEAERIASEREAGYGAIRELFAITGDPRIRLVFFEDAATKYDETGHQGAGWAYDSTVVEVFGPRQRLDPFHEVCHILTARLGDPPALFSEGVAVYVSERLGAPALKELGGGTLRVDDRVRVIRSEGQFTPLEMLMRRTEIGSQESKGSISYAEAASFTKFLVDHFGKEKFLAAYGALTNSDDPAVQEKNLRALHDIYGMPLSDLETRWLKWLDPS